jgi:hypothetical protein
MGQKMKNIIIAGDSFCEHDRFNSWTRLLADKLGMRLSSQGIPSGSFWETKEFLKDCVFVNKTLDLIIVAHTDFTRVPSAQWNQPYHKLSYEEQQEWARGASKAKEHYYKYLYVPTFHKWAQELWFREFSETYKDYKIVNLHCFPESWNSRHLLKGMNIGPNLAAISLNEINATDMSVLGNDNRRLNHFSIPNNKILADQLYNLISNYQDGDAFMDKFAFEQKTTKWFTD